MSAWRQALSRATSGGTQRFVSIVPRLTVPLSAMALLRALPPERAHAASLVALRSGLLAGTNPTLDGSLAVRTLGLDFPNPLGLAAGYDKDGIAASPLMQLGFGFVELGTVTRLGQAGNPRPRLFRLTADRAIINRMGFNNAGIESLRARLKSLRTHPVPLGVNVGLNKSGADPERDYPALVAAVAEFADYCVINVSSPNTSGLRDLQHPDRLAGVLAAVQAGVARRPPLLVKLAPDLDDGMLDHVVEVACAHAVDGLILTNTTVARPPGLQGGGDETGGLSGPPLRRRALEMLRRARRASRGRLVLIGCGGIDSGRVAFERIRAGATLVQLYTAFAYDGPALLSRLVAELGSELRRAGFPSISDAIGVDC